MGDWLLNLSLPWMAFVVFAATYIVAACVYLVVVRLAVGDRARAFKAFSPAMLPPLGVIFGLLVVSSPYRSGTTSIRPRLRLPQRPAHSEPPFCSLRACRMSRERIFML
jgi:hypothetical protein